MARREVLCNVPWAKRYVPGTAESGTVLHEECRQSSLAAPPNRCVWVARYRHPCLQPHKRPTRSKTFTPPSGEARVDGRITSEHLASQTVLKWLKTHMASRRPEWVSTALAPCSSCLLRNRGEECCFISEQRGLAPATMVKGTIEDVSGDSQNWSGEGTSESLSSGDDQPRVRINTKMTPARARHLRMDIGHKALPTAVTPLVSGHPASGAPLPSPARQGLLRVLVVGDANAKELGRLHESVQVTTVMKLGATWKKLSELPGTHKQQFHMVLTVLGTNDVPTTEALQKTWD